MRDRVELAESFIVFCDGLEEAGQTQTARRGRDVARELIQAERSLRDERRLRVVMQEQARRWERAFMGQFAKRSGT